MSTADRGTALVPISEKVHEQVREQHPKVTDRQDQLVVTLVTQGCSIAEAARQIGAHRVWATRVLQKEHVQSYADDLRRASMSALRLRATATAHELLSEGSKRQKLELVQTLLGSEEKQSSQGTQAVQVNINLGE